MLTQERPPIARTFPPDAEPIGVIAYRSRANGKPDWHALDTLTRAAQQRNRGSRLTGMLLYEDGRFFQTIEGPPHLLEPVWESIKRDPRHRDVEVLSMQVGRHRLYPDWDMRWVRKGAADTGTVGVGLDFLEPVAPSERFARLALADDSGLLAAELMRTHGRTSLADLLDYALEPTARALGDAWQRDDIDALALDVAIARLCRIVRDLGARQPLPSANGKRILAATFPREPHLLGAVAVAELHTGAGWHVDLVFPDTEAELFEQVAKGRYDRVDLSTSDALDRGGRTRAADIAVAIRLASENKAVEITFGGRAFWAERNCEAVGCRYRFTAAAFQLVV